MLLLQHRGIAAMKIDEALKIIHQHSYCLRSLYQRQYLLSKFRGFAQFCPPELLCMLLWNLFFSCKSIFMGSKTKNLYLGTGLLRPRAQVRYACWNRRQRQITVLFCVIKSSTLLQPQFIKEGKSDRCLHLLFL